jgi:hypothetical protein
MPNGRASRSAGLPMVRAVSFVRKMRGGCQSHLLWGDDGRAYVVKFINNLQLGRRALINEYIAAMMFTHLGVSAPEPALIEVDADFLCRHPEVHLTGPEMARTGVRPGIHFGSLYPGDPAVHSVYDFLPDRMLSAVYNRADFFGALVLDKWLGNADGRQAIFYRATVRRRRQHATEWVVSMIDHGHAFCGDEWRFIDSDVQGLYARQIVYGEHPMIDDFEPWLNRLSALPREVLEKSVCGLPSEWIDGDSGAIEALMKQLWKRRDRVPCLLESSLKWLQRNKRAPRPRSSPVRRDMPSVANNLIVAGLT